MLSDKSSLHVVIIGGGASGLACASRLCSHGEFNVTIVEATNRLGGRVHTVKEGG